MVEEVKIFELKKLLLPGRGYRYETEEGENGMAAHL
jgi:hypothetical protein